MVTDAGLTIKNVNIFVAFFHVASLFSTGVDNKKVGVDNEKALELTNSTVFHRARQLKRLGAGQQNIFFIFQPDFNIHVITSTNVFFEFFRPIHLLAKK